MGSCFEKGKVELGSYAKAILLATEGTCLAADAYYTSGSVLEPKVILIGEIHPFTGPESSHPSVRYIFK